MNVARVKSILKIKIGLTFYYFRGDRKTENIIQLPVKLDWAPDLIFFSLLTSTIPGAL